MCELRNRPIWLTLACAGLGIFVTLVEAYEAKHYSIEAPDPFCHTAPYGSTRHEGKSLESLLTSKSHVSEVLNRKRKLTIEMVHT